MAKKKGHLAVDPTQGIIVPKLPKLRPRLPKILDDSRMSDAERVVRLAMMGLSERQIAIELGKTEAFVHQSYQREINEGQTRAGAVVNRVIYRKALEGDMFCLDILFQKFNHERLRPRPKKIKKEVQALTRRYQPHSEQ